MLMCAILFRRHPLLVAAVIQAQGKACGAAASQQKGCQVSLIQMVTASRQQPGEALAWRRHIETAMDTDGVDTELCRFLLCHLDTERRGYAAVDCRQACR